MAYVRRKFDKAAGNVIEVRASVQEEGILLTAFLYALKKYTLSFPCIGLLDK
jgi:hypothetical protein